MGKAVFVPTMVGVICLTMAACGPVPKPFRTSSVTTPPELIDGDPGGVRVAMLEGPAAPMARLLSKAVAEDLVKRGIPSTADGGDALRYTLHGTVEELQHGHVPGKVARIHWSLTERAGQPFFTFSQDVEGSGFDWQWGSPKVILAVGANAARLIAEAVAPEDETLKPVQSVSAGVWVQPIRGAPGDGDKSLTRAMRFALVGAKVAVTSEKLAARHILSARVRVGPAQAGNQNVEVRWTISYPNGGQVGNAVQRNVVPAGTFDGRWGETAAMIAAAAVSGITNVLDQAENTVRYRVASGKGLKTDIVAGPTQPQLPPPNLSPDAVKSIGDRPVR